MWSRLLIALSVGVGLSATAEAQQDAAYKARTQAQHDAIAQSVLRGKQALEENEARAAAARQRAPNPPLTPAQRQATQQGVLKGKEAAAQNATQAAGAYNNAYNAAAIADWVAGKAAGQVPGGSTAYDAGKALGNHIMTQPVTVQRNPPPLPKFGYQPPPVPFQTCQNVPSLPNCGPAKPR